MGYKVFFSYAHRDEQLLEKLKEHLAPLKNQGLIDRLWYDREISAGTEWEPEIVRHLENADIILLLVSAAFMNSDYCYGKELQRAIQRHQLREARVVPIILSPVDWQIPPLDKLQALPTDGKPVTGAGWHSVDEALLNVVKGLRTVIKDLQKHPRSGSAYEYQMNYITQQVRQGRSGIEALNQCDPDLGKLFELVSYQYQDHARKLLQAQIDKLAGEVSIVGENDLRVQAEVTNDALGVVADSFNYLIEEFSKTIDNARIATTVIRNYSEQISSYLEEEMIISGTIAEGLDMLKKSSSDETHLALISNILERIVELHKYLVLIQSPTNRIRSYSNQLNKLVSNFRLQRNEER